jgi:PhnB protein
MSKATSPVPAGYHSVTPYLCVKGAAKAIEFYTKAFGATELTRMAQPDGRIGHAEIEIGDSRLMLADEFPEMGFVAPKGGERTPVMLHLYLADVDTVFARALEAGATSVRPVADQFYGDRGGMVEDPFGHYWYLSTHVEDVPADEMKTRMKAAMAEKPSQG